MDEFTLSDLEEGHVKYIQSHSAGIEPSLDTMDLYVTDGTNKSPIQPLKLHIQVGAPNLSVDLIYDFCDLNIQRISMPVTAPCCSAYYECYVEYMHRKPYEPSKGIHFFLIVSNNFKQNYVQCT